MGKIETKSYPLTIDYNKSLPTMIAAVIRRRDGWRSAVDKEITEQNFPVHKGPIKVEAVLLNSKSPIRTEAVLAELERLGLRPATLMELIAFGTQGGVGLWLERTIVELGSVWTCPENYFVSSVGVQAPDRRYVVRFYRSLVSGRSLTLIRFQNVWEKDNWFLAARR